MTGELATMRRGAAAGLLALACAALACATLTGWAYWPGLMSWDPVRQYGQVLSGAIDDWHPPAMEWVWRCLGTFARGPAPMLLLQLALYWGGFTLLAVAAWRRGRAGLACALLACGLWPFGLALTGMILKDSLMAGALLVASGLLALRERRGGAVTALVAAAMLLFAATLRFNAFLACLPLLVALLPSAWRTGWARFLVAGAIATLTLMAAMPLANRLIGARHSGVELSLVIFDLGGITERSNVDVFPRALAVADPIGVNHRCYRPAKWDSYSDWVDPECPLGYTAWNEQVGLARNPYVAWAGAILTHPIAYLEHRLHHFAINTRLMPLADATERPIPREGAPNRWGFAVAPNPALRIIDAAAMATAHTPLGWPIVWIGASLGALLASSGGPSAGRAMPIALSALLYGCGYLLFSVASELRYHLWTGIAALIATVLVLSDREGCSHPRLVRLFAPTMLAVVAGLVCRMIQA